MVSSVTSNPYYSYLSQLQAPQASAATTQTGGASSASGSSTQQSLVSSLLSGGNGFSSEALSLLQPDSSGTFNPITDLLGGSGTSGAVTSLYSNLYDSVEAASLTQAQEGSATANGTTPVAGGSSGSGSAAANSNPVQNLINAQTQASIAYNKTLVQNVAETVQSIVNA